MSIYAVILTHPRNEVWAKLQEEWPDHHYLMKANPTIAFVAPPGITIETAIGKTLGIDDNGDVAGMVVEIIDSTHGYVEGALVDWIKKARNG